MEKIKVRMAVVVDEAGNWSASGWRGAPKGEAMEVAEQILDPQKGNALEFYVEAELEIPKPIIVKGTARMTSPAPQ